MMHEFLLANRLGLIARCRAKVSKRRAPKATVLELEHGIPLFLDQLIATLSAEQGTADFPPRMNEEAQLSGRELMRQGFTVDQVVYNYGDLCQAITDLAVETNKSMTVDEYRTLNRCLDSAIAFAVTEFNHQRDFVVADQQMVALNERLGYFAHELRNLLNTATLALTAIKAGNVGLSGATGAVLDRSLVGLRTLIDRSLAEVRLTAGLASQKQVFSLADFIAEVNVAASLEARVRGCTLIVAPVDPALTVAADRDLLAAALGNLLQNAFKFTRSHSEVLLSAYSLGERIRIDVEDHCGGLPPGKAAMLFMPFAQIGVDRSGMGLGLAIARTSVQANQGTLTVRDLPGSGCVFTMDLPRHALRQAVALPETADVS